MNVNFMPLRGFQMTQHLISLLKTIFSIFSHIVGAHRLVIMKKIKTAFDSSPSYETTKQSCLEIKSSYILAAADTLKIIWIGIALPGHIFFYL